MLSGTRIQTTNSSIRFSCLFPIENCNQLNYNLHFHFSILSDAGRVVVGPAGTGTSRRRRFLHQRPSPNSNHRRSQQRVVVDERWGLAADTRLLLPRPSPSTRSGRLQGRPQLVPRTGKLGLGRLTALSTLCCSITSQTTFFFFWNETASWIGNRFPASVFLRAAGLLVSTTVQDDYRRVWLLRQPLMRALYYSFNRTDTADIKTPSIGINSCLVAGSSSARSLSSARHETSTWSIHHSTFFFFECWPAIRYNSPPPRPVDYENLKKEKSKKKKRENKRLAAAPGAI